MEGLKTLGLVAATTLVVQSFSREKLLREGGEKLKTGEPIRLADGWEGEKGEPKGKEKGISDAGEIESSHFSSLS